MVSKKLSMPSSNSQRLTNEAHTEGALERKRPCGFLRSLSKGGSSTGSVPGSKLLYMRKNGDPCRPASVAVVSAAAAAYARVHYRPRKLSLFPRNLDIGKEDKDGIKVRALTWFSRSLLVTRTLDSSSIYRGGPPHAHKNSNQVAPAAALARAGYVCMYMYNRNCGKQILN